MNYVFFCLGLFLLIFGAHMLVSGSVAIAERLSIPRIIVGLTLVAFGTSAPELAVSVQSALAGTANVALGNVLGSNIFNVLFILGLCALILPLSVSEDIVKRDVPILFLITLLVFYLAYDGQLSRWDGALLLTLLICYLSYLLFITIKSKDKPSSRKDTQDNQHRSPPRSVLFDLLFVIVGLLGLIKGSDWLVQSATTIALQLGISDLLIGLTLVAIGTSLPEVVTSVVAVFKQQRDIAVGNVIGSNIFNLLAVLGLTGVISKNGIYVEAALNKVEFPLLVVIALVYIPIVLSGRVISRLEGVFLFSLYLAYVIYTLMRAGVF